MYPHKNILPETFFFNVPLCWGWATWKESWQEFNNDPLYLWQTLQEGDLLNQLDKFGGDYLSSQLAHNISGKLDTWFIKWHASVLLKKGFTLFPSVSLVDNIGFDNSGVHNGKLIQFKNEELASKIIIEEIDIIENNEAKKIVTTFYKNLRNVSLKRKSTRFSVKKSVIYNLRKVLLKLIPELKKQKNTSNIVSKKNSYLGFNCKVYAKSRLNNTIIGNYSYIAENSTINNTIIGKFCSIGPNLICGWGIHPTKGISTSPMFYSNLKQNGMSLSPENKIKEHLPIIIGNDVFIGANVTILDGVTIGDGAVIGAGAVVSKNIPPYAIAVGCPINIINYRFEKEIIDKLIKIQWWDFNIDKLKIVEEYLFNIDDFIELYRN
ncbi:hypothetical protein DDV96_04115 [Marixanthomonas spongiae]|uniref:Uncharacterized protein n=2 Tax=Marixanthomonas spongiae TaxID=2174845 RepID=A0A2U0I678_9FLAO|nr:hypothetical protein DDV96_04115 [Marixanthomonas spongiae]